ncbi:MAG: alkaline phosphatase family protein [Acidobacteriaceae bacterium]|nr:alkaline phosphatase family protein [Acidobacteriaceae bacterium]
MPVPPGTIQHLVVLMMENRSFDHMFGFMMSPDYLIDGLTGDESNPDSKGNQVFVTSDANIAGDFTPDPGHHYPDVNMQIFGTNVVGGTEQPTMQGFVRSYEQHTNDVDKAHHIMRCFKPERIPVLTALAKEYAVCDRWFSSIPGPTLPNRSFIHSATSVGRLDMSPNWIDEAKTIYELLAAHNVESKLYFHDITMAMTFKSLLNSQGKLFGTFDDFLAACEHDSLAPYSFIEPQYNTSDQGDQVIEASDQHPDHNVSDGERLIRDVHNAIWKNRAVREKTILLVVYDEHGGLYDHVVPPATVSPDGKVSPEGFKFDRLMIREPAVVISPWIAQGTIDHTVYDHTSGIAMARKLFIPDWQNNFLTERDRQANTFESLLTLDAPRTDTVQFKAPEVVLDVPGMGDLIAQSSINKPLTDHQKMLVAHAFALEQGLPPNERSGKTPDTITTEGQASDFIRAVAQELMRRTRGLVAGGPVGV